MASGDRRPVRLSLLLLWVVTSSLFSTGLCGGEEYAVCNTRCCIVEPNCSAALQVTCNCQNEELVALRKGDFPTTVESIDIYGVREVIVYEHALLDLTSLVKLELREIDKLTVQPHGLALQDNASLFTFDMVSVKNLTIESFAFSGFWDRGTRIQIAYISRLYIKQNAFNFKSYSNSPSLIIEEAQFAEMSSVAFNATFTSLTLRAVSIELCKRNTFSGIIHRIEMRQVQIREVKEGCINGTGDLNWLSMHNCSLGIIHGRGIDGEICNVRIHNSDITYVQPNGFHLQVGSLRITRSSFMRLMTKGINVQAKYFIYLRSAKVHILQRNALIALQVRNNKADNNKSMSIYDFNVLHAEKGSLTFNSTVAIKLLRLTVQNPKSSICPIPRGVRWLTGTDESAPLTSKDKQILAELWPDWLCTENNQISNSVDPEEEEDEEDKWMLLIVVLVLLVVLCIILKLRKPKCNGTKSNVPSETNQSSDSKEYTEVPVTDGLAKKKNAVKPRIIDVQDGFGDLWRRFLGLIRFCPQTLLAWLTQKNRRKIKQE